MFPMSTSPSTRPRRPKFRASRRSGSYHHGDLRRALVDAALQLIEERGPRGFTLREAARLVGVTHTAPYRHFADRDALLAAVALEGIQGMQQAMADAVAGIEDPGTRLRALGVAYVTYAVAHPSHFRVMYSDAAEGAGGEEGAVAKQRKFGLLLETIRACQEAGQMPAGPPEPLALTAWASVHGLASLLIDGVIQRMRLAGGSPTELARTLTERVSAGLCGGASPPQPTW